MLRTIVLSTLSIALVATAGPALACKHVMRIQTETEATLLVQADKALRSGKTPKAFKLAEKAMRGLKSKRSTSSSKRLMTRAQRIVAVATIRLEGKVKLDGKSPAKAAQRKANMGWAIKELRKQLKTRPHDVYLKTRLGEALAGLPNFRQEALALLSDLAKKDLMADARGFVVLAKLRHEAGDTTGRDAAVKRCQSMAKNPMSCQVVGIQVGQS